MKQIAPDSYLSKSLFIRGLQCHKYLYLTKFQPELRGDVSADTGTRFRMGHEVGKLAQDLFPGGVEIPYEGLSHGEQLSRTAAEIAGKTPSIYEATFSHDGILVKADILRRVRGGWELYEVKSSTAVKAVHYNDVAVQYYVLTGSGLNVRKAFVVHVNKEYVRKRTINVQALFSLEDITKKVVVLQGGIPKELKKMRRMLAGGVPVIDIGMHCKDPYPCDFMDTCWKHIPTPSVFDLRERGADYYDLYSRGIVRLEDIPLDELKGKQRMQVEAYVGREDYIDAAKVREFLDGLEYPLSFLDFETFATPIPLYDGIKPYQAVPFQFSLHCIVAPGRKPQHFECLVTPGEDPRPIVLDQLLALIPGSGSILAYNASFETRIIRELASRFPRHAKKLNAVVDRLRDPMSIFRSRHVYLWQLQGSYSIKVVLPTLVPELSYEDEEIQDGTAASVAWLRMAECQDPEDRARIQADLLSYCRLDTFGVVKILEKLEEYARH